MMCQMWGAVVFVTLFTIRCVKCGAQLSLHFHSLYDVCVFRKRHFQPLVLGWLFFIICTFWNLVIVDKLLTVITVCCNIAIVERLMMFMFTEQWKGGLCRLDHFQLCVLGLVIKCIDA